MQTVRALCILLTWSSLASEALAVPGLRDNSAHTPPAVDLPAAGGSYIDPVFGTKILRITDASDGRICAHAYSYWPALNLDSTRLLIKCDDVPLLYRFDGKKAIADGRLSGDDGPKVQFDGASWSNLSPTIVYALDGMRLWRLDVSRRGAAGAKMIRDFTGLFPYGFELAQLTMSADDRVFSFHSRDAQTGAKLDAATYDIKSGKVRIFPRGDFALDESKVDKSGRWVMVDGQLGGFKLWDVTTGDVLSFDAGDADARPGGHADLGRSVIANSDGWDTGVLVRRFDEPFGAENLKNIVRYRRSNGTLNWTIADHVSLRSAAETFVIASTYAGDGSYSAFEDEIYLAFTDGSGFVRLAHTRSTEANPDARERYWAQPRAVVDRGGRWVVWTSDLGSSSRTDVLMLEIPEQYRPAPPPPPPAPPPPPDPVPPPSPDPVPPPGPAGDTPPSTDPTAPTAPLGVDPGTDPQIVEGGCSAGGKPRPPRWGWSWILICAAVVWRRSVRLRP